MILTKRQANSLKAAERLFTGKLVGDAGRHLGDAGEVADSVVAGGHLRIAEMEQMNSWPALIFGLGADPLQQSGVPLGSNTITHPRAGCPGDEHPARRVC